MQNANSQSNIASIQLQPFEDLFGEMEQYPDVTRFVTTRIAQQDFDRTQLDTLDPTQLNDLDKPVELDWTKWDKHFLLSEGLTLRRDLFSSSLNSTVRANSSLPTIHRQPPPPYETPRYSAASATKTQFDHKSMQPEGQPVGHLLNPGDPSMTGVSGGKPLRIGYERKSLLENPWGSNPDSTVVVPTLALNIFTNTRIWKGLPRRSICC